MTLEKLCSKFDRAEVVNTQMQLDRVYYASTDTIYSDGNIKTSIRDDGYIRIDSVQDANFVIFVDLENKIYLCIYNYTPENKYKLILQKLRLLKNIINELNGTDLSENMVTETINNHIDNDVIDINIFTCTECGSEEKLEYNRSKTNPEALEAKCTKCQTEYTFVPSKYYKLSSKRIIYFKSQESSRDITVINTLKNCIDE